MRPVRLTLTAAGLLAATVAVAAPPPYYDDATLRAVQFVDKNEGWAVGDRGVVWHSIDGGKSWERQQVPTTASLRAIQFLTPYVGFVAGRTELPHGAGSAGVVLSTTDGGATWKELTTSLLPGLNVVHFFDEKQGIVAGDKTAAFPAGLFQTEDGGATWKPPPGGQKFFDSYYHGDDGLPACLVRGSSTLGSVDPRQAAGWPLPVCATAMLDATTGWSVGDLGAILGTTDGGKTWATLKCGGQRAAVLFVHSDPKAVPLGAVAVLGGADGYQCVVAHHGDEARTAAAVRTAGGATADRLGDKPDVAAIVRAIRTWRPDVIVTDPLSPTATPVQIETLKLVQEAFARAADPKAFPEQIEKQGLTPHAAKKFYALVPTGEEASVTMDLTAFRPELGDCAKDYAEPAAALLNGRPTSDAVRFRLLAHRLPGAERHTSLMQGIDLAEGGTARRKRVPVSTAAAAGNVEREAAGKLRRQLETLSADPSANGGIEVVLLNVIGGLDKLPDDVAARTAVAIGTRFAEQGQWTAARELFTRTAERYAGYPGEVEAVRWLVRYHASGEARRRLELGHHPVFLKAALEPVADGDVKQAGYAEPFAPKPVYRFRSAEALRQWNQQCLDLEPKLAAFGSAYRLDPANVLALTAARRNLGLNARAAAALQPFAPDLGSSPADGWRSRMADERRALEAGGGPKSTPHAECRYAASRPLLDGSFTEPCWKFDHPDRRSPNELPVTAPELTAYPTTARFAYDDAYLYVAVTCAHPAGKQVPKADKRGRDADLTDHDRVEILLDLDRDYQTYYRLRVDHRGCVAEDCWGDTTWNPKWFVAAETGPNGWAAEVAIPLAELTGAKPTAGTVWAANVVRVVPGVGVASWGGLSAAAPTPAALGLLRFTGDAKSAK